MKRIALVCLTALLLVSACGGGDQTAKPKPTAKGPPTSDKPDVVVPDSAPPTELVVEDLKLGDGAEAKLGGTITVHYVGVAWSTKKQFEASWDRGSPATFPLREGGLIEGWTKGIPGMKVGGRRKLIIPPSLGYGERGTGPIGPNETLVFVIDLVKVD